MVLRAELASAIEDLRRICEENVLDALHDSGDGEHADGEEGGDGHGSGGKGSRWGKAGEVLGNVLDVKSGWNMWWLRLTAIALAVLITVGPDKKQDQTDQTDTVLRDGERAIDDVVRDIEVARDRIKNPKFDKGKYKRLIDDVRAKKITPTKAREILGDDFLNKRYPEDFTKYFSTSGTGKGAKGDDGGVEAPRAEEDPKKAKLDALKRKYVRGPDGRLPFSSDEYDRRAANIRKGLDEETGLPTK